MIFIIPIKKNSKRLKNKNFLILKKKPLFKWTTDFAKKFFNKENILISTDCEKTANLLKQNDFQVPFLRPKYLSRQSSSMFSVIYHAINTYEKKFNKNIKYLTLLQPTSPYRSISDLKDGLKLFYKNYKPTMSVTKLHVKSESIYLKENNFIKKLNYKKKISYIPNGSFYILKKEQLFKNKSFYFKEMNYVEIKEHQKRVDIDYMEDFKLASKI